MKGNSNAAFEIEARQRPFHELRPRVQKYLWNKKSPLLPEGYIAPFLHLSAKEQKALWRQNDSRVPEGWHPPGLKKWEELSEETKQDLWRQNDTRVPPDWIPEDAKFVRKFEEEKRIKFGTQGILANYGRIPEELIGLEGLELMSALSQYLERQNFTDLVLSAPEEQSQD